MKKQAIAYLLLLLIGAQMVAHFGYMKVDAKEPVVIPKEAIRLRILANSDSKEDQELKRKVRDEVKAQIDGWVALQWYGPTPARLHGGHPSTKGRISRAAGRRTRQRF